MPTEVGTSAGSSCWGRRIEWCRAAGLGVVVASAGPWRDLADLLGTLPTDALAYEVADGSELAAIRQREPERTIVLGSGGSAVADAPGSPTIGA